VGIVNLSPALVKTYQAMYQEAKERPASLRLPLQGTGAVHRRRTRRRHVGRKKGAM
jgi:hypothetical protein